MRTHITPVAIGLATLTLGFAASTPALAQECGKVQIADMTWASASLLANVDAFILENGYGCDPELVPGDTVPSFTSMNAKGKPDIAPELWVNFVQDPLQAAIAEGRMHSVVDGPITGVSEGWFVPPSFVEKYPELDTIVKILERPDLFPDSEDPSKGALIGCPPGWGCNLVTRNLFRAFDMEAKGWKLIDPGSGAGLSGSLAKAVERGEEWLGYYWAPTALAGKYGLVNLPWGVPYAGDEHWNGCIVKPEQECDDPQQSGWSPAIIHTVVTDEFKKAGGVAYDYLSKRVFPGDVMNAMLNYKEEEQASAEDTAIEFLENHRDVWSTWVSPEVAKKIDKAL